ncbi:MAG: folate-binding protein YgfZ [Acidobacteriia bacterium]|nr:folate-binding protein YgfZ [Terriglobia bacterium]
MILSGYQALREAAALFHLPGRGLIRATGADRARLLHAMSTNNVQELAPGQGCYAFFLTAHGKIVSDANIYRENDSVLLDVEPEARQPLLDHLNKFIIADDVTLTDLSSQCTVIAVEGPGAAAVLESVGAKMPPPGGFFPWQGGIIAGVTVTGVAGCRFIIPAGDRHSTWQWLLGIGALEASEQEIHAVRIENARPRFSEDFDNTCLVQEVRLMHGVHSNKGCYLGQEIVERVRSRGQVNRQLAGLQLETQQAPSPGTTLSHQGAGVGAITSAAYSPALGRVVALGFVRSASAAPNTMLDAAGIPARVTAAVPH